MSIEIRAARPNDDPQITEIFAHEAVIGNTSQIPHRDEAFWRDYQDKLGDSAVTLVALIDQRVVGQLNIVMDRRPRRRHTAWFGIAVHIDYHSRGVGRALMTEMLHQADNWLNITKLELGVFADNPRAAELYRRLGFKEEGRLVDDTFKNGAFVDTLLMARFHPSHRSKT